MGRGQTTNRRRTTGRGQTTGRRQATSRRQDHGPGRFRARGETPGNGVEYQPDGHAGPQTSHERHRQEVLLRVARISDALNQRLAL